MEKMGDVHDNNRFELKPGGTKYWVVDSKKILNVPDISCDERFAHSSMVHQVITGKTEARSLLIGPVFDNEGPMEERKVNGCQQIKSTGVDNSVFL